MPKKQNELTIERLAIADILLDPANVRIHGERNLETIKASLLRFGQQKPIVVDADGIVVAGNGTVEAATALGWKKIDVVRTKLKGADATAFAIADNRTAALADWDEGALALVLSDLDEPLLDAAGWNTDELGDLLASLTPEVATGESPEPKIDEAAVLLEKWGVVPGSLWALGDHRLLCGDSTDPAAMARLADGAEADLVVTDPPYGVEYQTALSTSEAAARHRRADGMEVANDNLGFDGTRALVCDAFKALPIRDGAAFYVFAPPGDLLTAFALGITDAGYRPRHQIVWVKDRFVMGRCDYHYRHEALIYGWREGAAHYFIDDHTQDSVWECKRPGSSKMHPTMKPVELVERAIINSSKAGWLIIDPFSGSGTTMAAAQNQGRRCYGMELEPKYCAVILERMSEMGLSVIQVD